MKAYRKNCTNGVINIQNASRAKHCYSWYLEKFSKKSWTTSVEEKYFTWHVSSFQKPAIRYKIHCRSINSSRGHSPQILAADSIKLFKAQKLNQKNQRKSLRSLTPVSAKPKICYVWRSIKCQYMFLISLNLFSCWGYSKAQNLRRLSTQD